VFPPFSISAELLNGGWNILNGGKSKFTRKCAKLNFFDELAPKFFSSVLNGGKFKLNPLKRELKAADRCRRRRQVTKRRRPALHVPTPAGAGEREEEKIDKIFAFVGTMGANHTFPFI